MTNYDMSKEPKLMYRCDPCNKLQIFCDRTLPKCSRCEKKGLNCGVFRKVKYKKQLHFIENHLTKISFSARNNNKIKKNRKESKKDKEKYERGKKELSCSVNQIKDIVKRPINIIEEKVISNQSYSGLKAIMAILNLIFSKSAKNNLLCLLQYPTSEKSNDGLRLLISIATGLNKLRFKLSKRCGDSIPNQVNQKELKIILFEAIQLFIKEELPFLTFLDPVNFDFKRCSYYLKLTILSIGLSKLHQTKVESIQQLMFNIDHVIYNHFKNITKLEYNFETLKVVALLLNYIKFDGILYRITDSLLNYAWRSIPILGLCYHQPNLSKEEKELRSDFLGFVLFIEAPFIWTAFPLHYEFSQTFQSHRLSNMLKDPNYFQKVLNLKKPQLLKIQFNLLNEVMVAFARYLLDLSLIKDPLITRKAEFEQCLPRIFEAFDVFKIRYQLIQTLFQQFSNQLKDLEILNWIRIYQNYSLLLINHLKFVTLTISFYNNSTLHYKDSLYIPNSLYTLFKPIPDQVEPTYLKLACYYAKKNLLQYIELMELHPSRFLLSSLAQTMMFLARVERDEIIQNLLHQGFLCLEKFRAKGSRLADMNFVLMDGVITLV